MTAYDSGRESNEKRAGIDKTTKREMQRIEQREK